MIYNLPELLYNFTLGLGKVAEWFTTPLDKNIFPIAPIDLIGPLFVGAITIIIGFKLIHLIIA